MLFKIIFDKLCIPFFHFYVRRLSLFKKEGLVKHCFKLKKVRIFEELKGVDSILSIKNIN